MSTCGVAVASNLPFKPYHKVLELGGGDRPVFRPNADMRWLPSVDIIADFNHPLPLPSESYDGIFSKFLLEHLSWRKVRSLISEVHRILKPGGIAVFITANLLEQAKKLVETQEWTESLIEMLFGSQEFGQFWDAGAHHCGFSPEYAVRLFKEAGFFEVNVSPLPNCKTDMQIEARKSGARLESS